MLCVNDLPLLYSLLNVVLYSIWSVPVSSNQKICQSCTCTSAQPQKNKKPHVDSMLTSCGISKTLQNSEHSKSFLRQLKEKNKPNKPCTTCDQVKTSISPSL